MTDTHVQILTGLTFLVLILLACRWAWNRDPLIKDMQNILDELKKED